MRVVIDTSVLVAGLRSRVGASAALLYEIAHRNLEIVASPALFLEYEAVLKRSHHNLPEQHIEGFLQELAQLVLPAEIWYLWRPQLSDADDEMVLEAAINGQADAIVTHNRRDFEKAAVRFGIAVQSPAEILNRIKSQGSQR
jgi:putative PIN family toxin of toxin-antitoxin system